MSNLAKKDSDHFSRKRFFTPGAPPIASWRDVLKWEFSRREIGKWPKWVEISPCDKVPALGQGAGEVQVTWISHASFLIQMDGLNILTDPIYSKRCSPFPFIGPKRVHAPGIPFDVLPRIDLVLLSHDHYDHCDLPTLRRILKRDSPRALTLLGNADLFRRAGFERVVELDWWETFDFSSSLRISTTPAQHWSKRLSSRRCRRLWGGFFLETPARKVYFCGDTGYHPEIFKEFGQRMGNPDLAMLPIGAYEPRWFMGPQHCNPADSVKIHREIGSKRSVAMHWGCFQLTDEARDEPPRALKQALLEAGLPEEEFLVLQPGESLRI